MKYLFKNNLYFIIINNKSIMKNKSIKYIEISEVNFKYFFTKGFIFPRNILTKNDFFEKDLFTIINNYIPVIDKNISNNKKNILLEIKYDLEFTDIWNWLYWLNCILPLSSIKKIYIWDKEVYESLINSDSFSNLPIPKKIIENKEIKLTKSKLTISKIEDLKNDNLIKLKEEYLLQNTILWGQQMLKIISNNIYNDFIFKNENNNLDLLYNYLDDNIENTNYNDFILIDFIKNRIIEWKTFEWKETLKELYDFVWKTLKRFVESWILKKDEAKIGELRLKVWKIKESYEEWLGIVKLLSFFNEEEDYGILFFLILSKYWKIEEFESFKELGLDKIMNNNKKILLWYLYWEIVWYERLYVELDNVNYKLDITDEYDIDIYEWNVSKDKIKISEDFDDGVKIKINNVYWKSNRVINNNIFSIKKSNIDWFIGMESKIKLLETEITWINSNCNKLEENNKILKKENEYKIIELNNTLELKIKDITVIEGIKEELEKELNDKNNSLIENEKQINENKEKVKKIEDENKKYKLDLNKNKKENEIYKEKIKKIEDENKEYKDKLNQVNKISNLLQNETNWW